MNDLYCVIHDRFYDVFKKELTNKEYQIIKNTVPTSILEIGKQWGYYDTEFNQKLYQWISQLNK